MNTVVTLSNMPDCTEQQIFDQVVTHIRNQDLQDIHDNEGEELRPEDFKTTSCNSPNAMNWRFRNER